MGAAIAGIPRGMLFFLSELLSVDPQQRLHAIGARQRRPIVPIRQPENPRGHPAAMGFGATAHLFVANTLTSKGGALLNPGVRNSG